MTNLLDGIWCRYIYLGTHTFTQGVFLQVAGFSAMIRDFQKQFSHSGLVFVRVALECFVQYASF